MGDRAWGRVGGELVIMFLCTCVNISKIEFMKNENKEKESLENSVKNKLKIFCKLNEWFWKIF